MDSEFQYNPMKRLCKTCRICWAIGHKHCPSLQTRWTGFSIDSPLCRLKSNPVQRNGEIGPSLPFLGHSQFQFPAIKAIWSTCTSRATGNTFSSFYLLLSITFFFKRTPTAFLSFSDYRCLRLPFGDVTGKRLPGLRGPAGPGLLEKEGPGWSPPGETRGSRGGSAAPGTGASLSSTHSMASLRFSPFSETASLAWWESRILLQEVGVYFFNANLVGKRVWLVAVAGLSEYSIMASKFKVKWRCCSPTLPPNTPVGNGSMQK